MDYWKQKRQREKKVYNTYLFKVFCSKSNKQNHLKRISFRPLKCAKSEKSYLVKNILDGKYFVSLRENSY